MTHAADGAEHAALSCLRRALDAYLDSDADARQALSEFGDIVVVIEITDLKRTYAFSSRRGLIKLSRQSADDETAADARISAPLKDFVALGLHGMKRSRLSALNIRGDFQLVQSLWNTLSAVDFNCESFLAPRIGDIAAHEVGRGVRAGRRFLRRSLDSLAQTAGEYVQEEARLSPNALCIEDFVRQVDALRDDLERLEARINSLTAKRERKPS